MCNKYKWYAACKRERHSEKRNNASQSRDKVWLNTVTVSPLKQFQKQLFCLVSMAQKAQFYLGSWQRSLRMLFSFHSKLSVSDSFTPKLLWLYCLQTSFVFQTWTLPPFSRQQKYCRAQIGGMCNALSKQAEDRHYTMKQCLTPAALAQGACAGESRWVGLASGSFHSPLASLASAVFWCNIERQESSPVNDKHGIQASGLLTPCAGCPEPCHSDKQVLLQKENKVYWRVEKVLALHLAWNANDQINIIVTAVAMKT